MHDNILAISLCERHKFCNCLCLRPGRGVTVSVSVHNLCVYLSPGNKLTAKWQSQLCIQPYKALSPSLRGSAPYLCKSYLCLEHRRKHGIGSLYRRESTRGELPNDDNSPKWPVPLFRNGLINIASLFSSHLITFSSGQHVCAKCFTASSLTQCDVTLCWLLCCWLSPAKTAYATRQIWKCTEENGGDLESRQTLQKGDTRRNSSQE